MPLYRRLLSGVHAARRQNRVRGRHLKSLAGFTAGAVVDPDGLVQAGLIKGAGRSRVKILGRVTCRMR